MKTSQQFLGMPKVCLVVILYLLLASIVSVPTIDAQQPTVGLLQYEQNLQQDGYILFSPIHSTTTYLINKCGQQVHSWTSSYKPGLSVHLLQDGSILRTGNVNNPRFALGGGSGGIIEKIAWDGTLLWSYQISDSTMCQHHDIRPMLNGNVLAIVWEAKTYNEAISVGRDSSKTNAIAWFEKIIEIAPTGLNTGKIVWQWRVWDHLIQDVDEERINYGNVAVNPERINVNYMTAPNPKTSEWIHANSIDYNPELDQIMISAYGFNEIWIIDHSTTTEEAASDIGGNFGKGGGLLYRWGNPAAFNRGTGSNKKLFGQHSAHWIPNELVDGGKIMIFNNGLRGSTNYSSVDIIAPPQDGYGNYFLESNKPFDPIQQDWIYTDSIRTKLFSSNYSGAQRLPNGNTLICSGSIGLFFEITPSNKYVWEYKNPVSLTGTAKQGENIVGNSVFRAELYSSNFIGFNGRDLTPSNPIELQPLPSLCTTTSVKADNETNSLKIYPNPVEETLQIQFGTTIPTEVLLISSLGEVVLSQKINSGKESCSLDIRTIPAGMYILKLLNGSSVTIERVIIAR
jgi:hypothetical protein